jgi:hypothetical protein
MKLHPADRSVIWALVVAVVIAAVGLFASRVQDWKDPISAAVTILAAALGGLFIWQQIRASERQEKRRRDKRFLAARAAMPLTLSHVTTYSSACAKQLGIIYETRNDVVVFPVPGLETFPHFPNEAVTDFRAFIEFGPGIVGGEIATLLQKIQVQRARLDRIDEWNAEGKDNITLVEFEQYVLDAIELYVRAANLFEYARFEADTPKPTDAVSMRSGYRQLFDIDIPETLEAKIDRWKPRFETKLED